MNCELFEQKTLMGIGIGMTLKLHCFALFETMYLDFDFNRIEQDLVLHLNLNCVHNLLILFSRGESNL